MINLTEISYPFYSYVPLYYVASVFAIVVYISLIGWFIQSLDIGCRPPIMIILIFVTHLALNIELVLRGMYDVSVLNSKTLYRITTPMLSIPPRLLLLANYRYLVELRGRKARGILDRMINIIVLVGAITAEILLGIANELAFKSNYLHLNFRLRQASAGLILALALLFYVVWYFATANSRRGYLLTLLGITSACVLIEAIYVQLISIPKFFYILNQSEVWFYLGHLIPIVIALITWTICHPWRLLLLPKRYAQSDETCKVLLPSPSTV